MTVLTPGHFAAFFEAIHGQKPFPWQERLAVRVTAEGKWPAVLDLPTGSGKTAAIDVAIFHLALEAEGGQNRRAPVRVAFVVDRRLVVDDAFKRAEKIARRLAEAASGSVLGLVAERLAKLSGNLQRPLIARRLRGGLPREDDWARTPAQPTVLCSTVDQIGSRLLFRGYGVSDRMKPVHAGLIGSDCLILLDEAHLAEPFQQTLEWVAVYQSDRWRDRDQAHQAPWGVSLLTATPRQTSAETFALEPEDYEDEALRCRLDATKPARLLGPKESHSRAEDRDDGKGAEEANLVARIVKEVDEAFSHLRRNGIHKPAVGVVVNRVARARAVFERLEQEPPHDADRLTLLIGPSRPVDRDEVVGGLEPIRTRKSGEARVLEEAVVIVATQCIEVGVDIDLDALVTEAAPIDALRQRFGRLNRAGREMVPYAAVLASRFEDPVYGKSIRPTWEYLTTPVSQRGRHAVPTVDFGLNAFRKRMTETPVPCGALSPKEDAPVLLPAHLDLLSQTSPVPAADPDVALYLHGADRSPDSVTLVWRADLEPDRADSMGDDRRVRRLLLLVPPRAAEAIELPHWVVRRWLEGDPGGLERLADIAVAQPVEETRSKRSSRRVFRWKGDDERSGWIDPDKIRPGDTIVVPASYGGLDAYGWKPGREEEAKPVADVAAAAARSFSHRRFVVRVAPGLLGTSVSSGALAEALATSASQSWRDIRTTLAVLALSDETKQSLEALDQAKGRRDQVKAYHDLYGYDDQDRPRGIVFVAQFGINGQRRDHPSRGVEEDGRPGATEDDTAGSLPGFSLSLEEHSKDVEKKAEEFARLAGLPADRIADLKLAGFLHDAGKSDVRFQSWLHYGDPLGPDPDDPGQVLAKSGRSLPRRAREASGLPENWRHEAFSVRLAVSTPRLAEARDRALVLWLVGSHHGYGRPLFPHDDPYDAQARALPPVLGLPSEIGPTPGPQSLAFDWNGLDWAGIYVRLKARYGVWELARMEAILRLADHRASEEAADRQTGAGGAT